MPHNPHSQHHRCAKLPPEPRWTAAFRTWYVGAYCTEAHETSLAWLQSRGTPTTRTVLRWFFRFWTELNTGTFYMLSSCAAFWTGQWALGVLTFVLLTAALYITSATKDTLGCPRPGGKVKHGGTTGHSNEYGFPSTHTACALVFGVRLYMMLNHAVPSLGWVWLLFASSFIVNVAGSRLYLGMHWVADLVGGAVVAAVVFLLQLLYEPAVLGFIFPVQRSDIEPVDFALLLFGVYVMVKLHPAPRGPCPCYVDTYCLAYAITGVIFGLWFGAFTTPHLQPPAVGHDVFTAHFLATYAAGIVFAAGAQTVVKEAGKVVLPSLFEVGAGSAARSVPPPLRVPYVCMCIALGLVLCKVPDMAAARAMVRGSAKLEHRVWNTTTHRFWKEADVFARGASFVVIGFSVSYVVPHHVTHWVAAVL